jgi:hypothetical protein
MGGAMFGGQGGPMQQSPFQQLQGMGGPQFGGQNPNQIPQGIDPQAVAANPGDFFRYMQGMRAQEGVMPGSTMMSQPQGGNAGGKGGMPGGDSISSLPPQLQGLQRQIQARNAMNRFGAQGPQGLAGLMGSQQSSTNSLK